MNRISLLILLLLACTGCRRDLLSDEVEINYAEVGIEIDWQKAGITPDDATVMLYREGDAKPTTHIMSSNSEVVKMREGIYSIIVFNQKIGDFDAIDFRNTESYTTIQAFAKPLTKRTKQTQSPFAAIPDPHLAVASLDEFVVTSDMVNQTRTSKVKSRVKSRVPSSKAPVHTLRFEPKICVSAVKVTVHVEGLNNVRKETVNGIIDGFADGLFLCSQLPTSNPVSHLFEFTDIAYNEGSATTGHMEGYINTFGMCDDSKTDSPHSVILVVEATLRDADKTKFRYENDVTNSIEESPEVGIKLKIEIKVDVPNVPHEGGGWFDPTIPGWGDDVVIEK